MKILILLFYSLISTQLFAATVELGKYLAIPKDLPTVSATIELLADNKATVFIDSEGTIVNCTGTFTVIDNKLNAHADCDHPDAPKINVIIDITNVTPEGLRSEAGVEVPVIFDLLGDDTYLFTLKKVD